MGFFRSRFGPSRDEIWKLLCSQIDGQVLPGSRWRGEKLQAQTGEWIVTLDEYSVMMMIGKVPHHIPHTRLRAPFPNPAAFRFSIYRASVFSALGTLLGMQDIQIGHPEFDQDFVIKGNNEDMVRVLCGNRRLRELVNAQPNFKLSIEDDDGWFGAKYPSGVDVLTFDVAAQIRNVERLKGLFDVFAETLHQLSEMGLAGKGTGGVLPK